MAPALYARAAQAGWPAFQFDAQHSGRNRDAIVRVPLEIGWTITAAPKAWTLSSAVTAEDRVYIGTTKGEVLALDRKTGQETWRYVSQGSIYLAPAISSGRIIFGSADGLVVALDAATGSLQWSYNAGSNIRSSPNISDGRVYFASNDGNAYALDLASGQRLWRTELGGYLLTSPAVDDSRIYLATLDGRIFSLNRDTGGIVWQSTATGEVSSSPSVSSGVVFMGSHDGQLRAYLATTGALAWSSNTGAPIVNGIAISTFAVFAASLDGKLRAHSISDGAVLWTLDTSTGIHAAPIVVGDKVLIGAEDNRIYVAEASNGNLLSTTTLSGRIAAPVAASAGNVYVLTDDGVFTALQSPNFMPNAPVALSMNGQVEPTLNTNTFTFQWHFSDPDTDDRQSSFSLAVASGAPVFDAPIIETGMRESADSSFVLDQTLSEGRYFWQVQTFDLFGASSPYSTATFVIDRTPPLVSLLSPVGGEMFVPTVNNIVIQTSISDNFDPAPVVEAFLVELEDRGSPRGTAPSRVEVSTGSVFSPLDIDDGLWRLEVTATDSAGNSTSTFSGSFEVIHDVRPPRTTLTVGAPIAEFGGLTTITRATLLNLSSTDDLANADDGIGLGVAAQWVSIDGVLRSTFPNTSPASGQIFSSTFTLTADSDGLHLLAYHARDTLGNDETVHVATVAVDNTAPQTSLTSLGGLEYIAPATLDRFVSSETRFCFLAVDPVIGGAGAGVAATRLKVNEGVFSIVTGTFTLSEGLHTLVFESEDRVGNLEIAKSTTVAVDASAPRTSLLVMGGRQHPGIGVDSFYASSDTRIALVAEDPLINGVASGLASIDFDENDGATQPYVSSFTLTEGAHSLSYRSHDNVGNLETLRSTRVLVDQTPPVSEAHVGGAAFTATDGSLYISSGSPVTFAASDPTLSGSSTPGSGVARIEIVIDSAPFTAYASALTFGPGRHVILYRSVDNVGNVETTRTLEVRADVTPPETVLSVSTPSFGGYVSPATAFTLTAVDPGASGEAAGVAFTRYRINGGAFAAYSAEFKLSGTEGPYALDYHSQDQVGNLEVFRSTSVLLDQTPPVSTVHIGTPTFVAADGSLYLAPGTPVEFKAEDPALANSGAVGSGVRRIEVSLDGAAFAPYAAALNFTEGLHVVLYRAVDNVGNVESARELRLRSDATPPLTTFAPSGAFFTGADGTRFAPPSFSYELPAEDPVRSDVASGLAFTRYSLDSGAFQAYATTFTLTEGVRRVYFQSQDNLGHLELLRGATVFVDATAPLSTLEIGAPQFISSSTVYVSTATPFSLASQDPKVEGVASGVSAVSFRFDAAAFGPYLSVFTIPAPDGLRSVSWFATDNVGNAEAAKNANMTLDATAPRSSLIVIGGRLAPGLDAASFYASSDTRIAFTGEDPIMGGVASGLAQIRFQDNGGAFQSFAGPLALDEGRHALGYQGQDNVLNLEVLRSTTVLVDATPPVTTVSIGAPSFTASDATVYIAPASSISFSAADPSLPSGESGSGVERVEASVDGGVFAAFTAPLTFSEGFHSVRYRALDRVGNVEAERTLQLRSDATPPASELAIGEPSFQLSSATVLVSSTTPLSVAALDPTVNGVASGVKESFYRFVDVAPSTAPFLVFTASFTFTGADGAAAVEFYSRDRVLNIEPVRSRALLLDSTRPEAAIDTPNGGDGICSVVKGMIPVRGTAQDQHFSIYSLESAPGRDASASFVLVSSGSAAVDAGLLGTWDARALSGWQTLRLTVVDQVRNTSVATLSVFVGDPGRLLVLGNHETFNMPQGVAADADGRIYVADTNDDRVQVFSATGTALVSFGRGHGRDKDEDASLRLNKPKGVAVDAAGAVYVADTHNDRVLKLSATGQILLEVGRRKPGGKDDDGKDKGKNESQEFLSGKRPGEFRKPSGIAVDGHGNIFVADTDNNRIQKLGPDGAPLLSFDLPAASGDGEAEDLDCESPELGRPVGIALDGAGNIYVADPRGARALKFSAAGQLLMTLPVHREGGSGKPGRPVGIAVSPEGNCILVSDQRSSRVIKFDAAGAQTLAFGERGKIKDNRPLPKRLLLRKPAGLALGAGGKLYVADRNNNRIQVFGLPTGEPASVVPPSAHGHDDEYVARDVVDHEDGGLVEREDRAGVSIPAGALAEDLKITVSTPAVAVESDRDRNRDEQNLKVVSAPVEYGPEGTKFTEPVTLTLPYTPDLIAAQGVAEDSLKINYWNKEKGEWEALESEVDKKNGTVKAKTPHFSLYQVLGSTGVSTAIAPLAADAAFTFRDAYAFPNPVRGSGPVTIRIQTGLADSVEVRVYDVSGRKIHSSSNFSLDPNLDDGNGKGAQFTYDHVWDVSGVGSGVYQYVITAKKSGQSDIHKTGRVGVVK